MAPVGRLLKFDYLVIGGGSGGIASARRAAQYGVRVALVEKSRLGGTCVNVGCVPKKVMFNAATLAERAHDMADYGIPSQLSGAFNWGALKEKRDAYIKRLNGIYAGNLQKSGVEVFEGAAQFVSPKLVRVNSDVEIEAEHILVAVGGRPNVPTKVPGHELGITSDGFFELESLPRRTVVVGVGYIGIELAGILNALGSEVHVVSRSSRILRNFDSLIQDSIRDEMTSNGVKFLWNENVASVTSAAGSEAGQRLLQVRLTSGAVIEDVSTLIWAMGRSPNTDWLAAADGAGIALDAAGNVKVDEFQNTSVPGVYAVGDVAGRALLTPVAIAAGRRLADRLFGGQPEARLDYANIPSVIFSHPPSGTCGLTQEEAEKLHGADKLKIYQSDFLPMYFSVTERKSRFRVKLICLLPTEKVIGLHLFGEASDEILQGFSVAMRMGATKADFDSTVAIHPTSAEELVTLR